MDKPVVKGPVDGNAFAVLAVAIRAMRRAGEPAERIKEMTNRATSDDYDHLLGVVQEYVDFDLDSDPVEDEVQREFEVESEEKGDETI